MRRAPGFLLVLLAVTLVGATPTWAQQPTDARPQPLAPDRDAAISADAPRAGALYLTTERFRRPDGSFDEAERGRLFVPGDRSDPTSPLLSLELYRFPATSDRAAQRPPIVRLFGGPGFGGFTVDELEEPRVYRTYVEPLRDIADVIIVGQRGIGSSRPHTRCEPPSGLPPDTLLSAEAERERIRRASRRCKQFWAARGLALQGFTVMEAAADVDAVREALGYETITLRGQSFGSHWAMAVMRRYPETVERAVLSGLEGPNHTYDMPSGVLNALERMAADAEQDSTLAPHIPDGGLVRALDESLQRLKDAPVSVTVARPETGDSVTVRLGYPDRGDLADGYGPVPDSLRYVAGWPRDVLALYGGDYTAAARDKAEDRTGTPGAPTASFFMLDCGSGITPEREQRLNEDPARAIVGNPAFAYQAACPVWNSDLGKDFRTGFETDVPTVMVHGTWDRSTPYQNAEELRSAFANGTLVTVERGTHSAYRQALDASDRFATGVRHFLKTGDTSQLPGTVTLPPVDWIVPNRSQ
jgi:pimeloyl-ACP methyl ester carboxylesterase